MYCYVFYQKGYQDVFDIGLLRNLAIKVSVQYEVYASRPVIAYTHFDCAPLSYSLDLSRPVVLKCLLTVCNDICRLGKFSPQGQKVALLPIILYNKASTAVYLRDTPNGQASLTE